MSLLTFSFCGVDAVVDLDLIVNDISIPVAPEISESTQDVPGMVGKIFLGNSYGQRVFDIEVTIKAKNSTDLADKIHDLSDIFMTVGDDEYPMQFSNDPEFTYYGRFSSIGNPEWIVRGSAWRRLTLQFTCSDPKGYGDYIKTDMKTNPVSLLPLGRSETYPIFTCIPKKDVSKIAVTDEDGNYVFLGAGVDADDGDTVQDLEPLVMHDNCNDLTLWSAITKPTFVIENGIIQGSFKATANAFQPSSWGNNYSGKWHGPMIQRWLPGSYSDYRIRARILNYQYYPRAMGKVELYLLDSNGARIGKIEVGDHENSKKVKVKVQVGNDVTRKNIYDSPGTVKNGATKTKTIKVKNGTKVVTKTVTVKGKKKTTKETVQVWKNVKVNEDLDTSTFTNFYGYVELKKIGKVYRVEILKLTNGSNPGWSKPIVVTWTDTKSTYQKDIAGIALYAGKYDIYEDIANPRVSYTTNTLQLCDVTVDNIINGGNVTTKPQIIARKNDEIKINSEDHTIYKNGGYFMSKFYIGSQFLNMEGGVYKTFAFEPSLNDADWYVEYTPTTS